MKTTCAKDGVVRGVCSTSSIFISTLGGVPLPEQPFSVMCKTLNILRLGAAVAFHVVSHDKPAGDIVLGSGNFLSYV